MGVGREGQTDNSRDGSKQYPKSVASMDIPDPLLHVQTTDKDVTGNSPAG
jgi:hypothetical protein